MPLATTDLTFAKVGGPPDDWVHIVVVDLDKNQRIMNATMVRIWNLEDGRGKVSLIGDDGGITERQGRFALYREVD